MNESPYSWISKVDGGRQYWGTEAEEQWALKGLRVVYDPSPGEPGRTCQDAVGVYLSVNRRWLVWVVADGVGGTLYGDEAARVTVSSLLQLGHERVCREMFPYKEDPHLWLGKNRMLLQKRIGHRQAEAPTHVARSLADELEEVVLLESGASRAKYCFGVLQLPTRRCRTWVVGDVGALVQVEGRWLSASSSTPSASWGFTVDGLLNPKPEYHEFEDVRALCVHTDGASATDVLNNLDGTLLGRRSDDDDLTVLIFDPGSTTRDALKPEVRADIRLPPGVRLRTRDLQAGERVDPTQFSGLPASPDGPSYVALVNETDRALKFEYRVSEGRWKVLSLEPARHGWPFPGISWGRGSIAHWEAHVRPPGETTSGFETVSIKFPADRQLALVFTQSRSWLGL